MVATMLRSEDLRYGKKRQISGSVSFYKKYNKIKIRMFFIDSKMQNLKMGPKCI